MDPRVIGPLEGLDQLKNPMTSSGIESATFWACSIVPQATTLPRALVHINIYKTTTAKNGIN
jgi:hypothetical protein